MIIRQIVIFNKEGDKRYIPFDSGLSIITGDSKTGKSALIEIVDYCLFSSRSSIPKGRITDFADLYVVVFQKEETFIVIGRPAAKFSKISEAYINTETDYQVLEDLQFSYFDDLSLKPIKNDAQTEFEEIIGLSLRNFENNNDNHGKLSVRDTVSFLFQHQNMIANKHAIFYRFDDVNKRKRVIDALPVLLGLVDAQYFELIKQKKQLERNIKSERKFIEKIQTKKQNEQSNLRELIQLYYTMLGQVLPENLTINELREIGSNLPMPPSLLNDQSKLFTDIRNFEKERELKYVEKEEVEKSLSSLYHNNDESFDYAKILVETNAKQKFSVENLQQVHCPLCENPVKELNEDITKIVNSKEKLISELSKIENYSKDYTQIVSRLQTRKRELDSDIRKLSRNINELSKLTKEYQDERTKRDQIIKQKGVIETTIKNFLELNKLTTDNGELNKLQKDLRAVNEKLKKYEQIATFKEDTEEFLKENMDRIALQLDFEEELKPPNFFFDTENFTFYHKHKSEKIRLDEMGSGANWLACHLSIFLSFLHLTCKYKKSTIPTFLMIDQPSQVYFPRTTNKEELIDEEQNEYDLNIQRVRDIFKVLNKELKRIGNKAQIIVLEHANEPEFKDFIIRDWNKNKGQGLI